MGTSGTPPRLHTPLCELLGIEHALLQSGMGRIAGPELVAEVSNAGALGILAGLHVPPDELRRQVARVRSLTARPFGVNLWMHEAMLPPPSPASLPETQVRAVQTALDGFRHHLGLPPSAERPAPLPDLVAPQLEVLLEERVPVFSIGLGNPGADLVARFHEGGTRVMAMAATVTDARTLDAAGVDVIVAQGGDAGGHRSTWVKADSPQAAAVGTMALVPEIVDAVRAPVVAAGGIADGRGVVAALALGAQGALLGTRFVATRESMALPFFKQAIVDARADSTRITDVFTGLYARALQNRFLTDYEASGAPVFPPFLQLKAAEDVYAAAARKADREYFPMLVGQSVGIIRDLPGAGDVVRAIVEEAERVRRRLSP